MFNDIVRNATKVYIESKGYKEAPGTGLWVHSHNKQVFNLLGDSMYPKEVKPDHNGCYALHVKRDKKCIIYTLYTLKALAFIPLDREVEVFPNGKLVCVKTEKPLIGFSVDGNKNNLNINNIRWGTKQEQFRHYSVEGIDRRSIPVEVFDEETKISKVFGSTKSAARYYGIDITRFKNYREGKLLDGRYRVNQVSRPLAISNNPIDDHIEKTDDLLDELKKAWKEALIENEYCNVPTTGIWVHKVDEGIYNFESEKTVMLSPIYGEYVTTATWVYGKRRPLKLHVLRALAFIPLGKFEKMIGPWYDIFQQLRKKGIVINHKDGNKFNNNIDNLEWETYKGNSDHAHDKELFSSRKPIYLYDAITKEEKRYANVSRVEKYTGLDKQALAKYMRSERNTLFAFRYLARFADEKCYPVDVPPEEGYKSIYGTYKLHAVSALNKKTGEIREFYTPTQACQELGLPEKYGSYFNNGSELPIITERYVITLIKDINILEKLAKEYREERIKWKHHKRASVRLTDKSGEVTEYLSVTEAAKALDLSNASVINRLKLGEWKETKYEYIDTK